MIADVGAKLGRALGSVLGDSALGNNASCSVGTALGSTPRDKLGDALGTNVFGTLGRTTEGNVLDDCVGCWGGSALGADDCTMLGRIFGDILLCISEGIVEGFPNR